ncbi:glycosyltransferase [Saccharopolyspora hordei]|uniref:Glycosyltransferase involved in cell wall biosynthesis n=1 Tax=Saccharopolyspora hordei TaxID=1838 RepID=A0A853ACC8_9PSEU|nr:glycosyltransferase [Saccharopolyspora hordei]NYI81506.1 glycosyltransferase involved in cell wall biosynthesis [Saccharopolyspora hordei]
MTSQPHSRPLRIVVGATTYPPHVNGAANFGHRLATGLSARGHDVHVVCHSSDRSEHIEVEDGVTVHRVPSYGSPFHPEIRGIMPWEARQADGILAGIQPDVVHVQSHFFICRGLINSARKRGLPLVATNHFMPENIFGYIKVPQALQDAASRLLWHNLVKHYSKAQLVTAPTPRAVQLLHDNGFTDVALPVSCGIDVERYRRPAQRYRAQHPDPETRTVLFVGRLDEEKHIDDLLRAMSLLRTTAPTRLEIVGNGSRREAFEQLARDLGIQDRVVFHGYLSDEELLEAYARADLFCMPSIAELQSLATMEAMSAGTPVVLANAMALPHLVQPGQNGWLYPPRDVHALARAIDDVLADRATIARMGAASERLVSRHDIDEILGRFESIYHHVIDPEGAVELDEIRTELAS